LKNDCAKGDPGVSPPGELWGDQCTNFSPKEWKTRKQKVGTGGNLIESQGSLHGRWNGKRNAKSGFLYGLSVSADLGCLARASLLEGIMSDFARKRTTSWVLVQAPLRDSEARLQVFSDIGGKVASKKKLKKKI